MSREFFLKSIVSETLYSLAGGSLLIGRGNACDINIDSGLLSRRHAKVSHIKQQLLIEDLGSTNGTYVNGQRIQSVTELKHGDLVAIGDEKLYVMVEDKSPFGFYAHQLSRQLETFEATDDTSNRTMIRSPISGEAGWGLQALSGTLESGGKKDSTAQKIQASLAGQDLDRQRVPAVLIVKGGYRDGSVVQLKLPHGASKEWAIGRSQLADVVLDDPTVSTIHAAIRCDGDTWFLTDQQSTNGVKLNNKSVSESECSSGDTIAIGSVEFIFYLL